MNREYLRLELPYPRPPHGDALVRPRGRPIIWFPTSVGRFHQNEDFGLTTAVKDLIEGGAIQFACVDSVDAESFYAKEKHPAERIRRHDQYDQYLYNEVVPFVRTRAQTSDG